MDYLSSAAIVAALTALAGVLASVIGLIQSAREHQRAVVRELRRRTDSRTVGEIRMEGDGRVGDVVGDHVVNSTEDDPSQDRAKVAARVAPRTASGWLHEKAAILALVGVLVTAIFGPVAGALAQRYFSPAVIDCIDHRSRALDLAEAHGPAWVPLADDDPVERQCSVNEMVARVLED